LEQLFRRFENPQLVSKPYKYVLFSRKYRKIVNKQGVTFHNRENTYYQPDKMINYKGEDILHVMCNNESYERIKWNDLINS